MGKNTVTREDFRKAVAKSMDGEVVKKSAEVTPMLAMTYMVYACDLENILFGEEEGEE